MLRRRRDWQRRELNHEWWLLLRRCRSCGPKGGWPDEIGGSGCWGCNHSSGTEETEAVVGGEEAAVHAGHDGWK